MSFSSYTRQAHDYFARAHLHIDQARSCHGEQRQSWIDSARTMNRIGLQWLKNARLLIKIEDIHDRNRTA